ncbi:MAG: YeeE/YedE thiosulfate transporter family protein [Proteobacteria bacterium]|nr:YeeE/YedE thiosulfate transporter family protein [Pseudomonadota bacterium]
MENFTPIASLIGGLIIGGSATVLLLTGRMAGISGIFAGLLPPKAGDWQWRSLFVVGLIIGAALYPLLGGNIVFIDLNPYGLSEKAHLGLIAGAGLLVGFGTYIGSGCTSGHGVCGIGRLSARSIVATVTFMIVAVITVFVMRLLTGESAI